MTTSPVRSHGVFLLQNSTAPPSYVAFAATKPPDSTTGCTPVRDARWVSKPSDHINLTHAIPTMVRIFFTCRCANCGAKRRLKVGYSNVNVRCTRLLGVVRGRGDCEGISQHTNSAAFAQQQRKKYTKFKVRPETMQILRTRFFWEPTGNYRCGRQHNKTIIDPAAIYINVSCVLAALIFVTLPFISWKQSVFHFKIASHLLCA